MAHRILAALCFCLLFTACARYERAAVAERAKTELIGLSKAELLACAGVPHRRYQEGDLEIFTYSASADSVGVGVVTGASPQIAVGAMRRRYCEATFALRNNRVERVSYAGRTGGLLTKGEQCGFVVENCVSP